MSETHVEADPLSYGAFDSAMRSPPGCLFCLGAIVSLAVAVGVLCALAFQGPWCNG